MSSSCIEEVSVPDDNWSRIVSELLGRAGIKSMDPPIRSCRLKIPLF
jgi:cyclopropane-fatty-acyl-phospholipid synthase